LNKLLFSILGITLVFVSTLIVVNQYNTRNFALNSFLEIEKNISEKVSWIPSHPIAGTEESGPEAGFAELFQNRWCILTPSKKSKEKDTCSCC